MSPVLTLIIGFAIGCAVGYTLFALQESKAKKAAEGAKKDPTKKPRAPRKSRQGAGTVVELTSATSPTSGEIRGATDSLTVVGTSSEGQWVSGVGRHPPMPIQMPPTEDTLSPASLSASIQSANHPNGVNEEHPEARDLRFHTGTDQ